MLKPSSKSIRHHILHVLNLDTIGGVEHLFSNFIGDYQSNFRQVDYALITGNKINPDFRKQCNKYLESFNYLKYWHNLKIPKKPSILRKKNIYHYIRRICPQVGVIWNRFGDHTTLDALMTVQAKVIYYEHGSAWLTSDNIKNKSFLDNVDLVLCASFAAQRVIQLRWGFTGRINVILNCLRPDTIPINPKPKIIPHRRPLRLGIAARLIPLKGIGVAIHALSKIRHHSPIELHIAGEGPLKNYLSQQAKQLGLGSSVIFHGHVKNMSDFFQFIDLLLVPSLREPFGLVIIEAAAHGCPSICTNIDGIPEVVDDGVTGLVLKPTLEIELGQIYGGGSSDFPSFVYDPKENRLVKPMFLDPMILANTISKLIVKPEKFNFLSKMAISHAHKYSLKNYVKDLRGNFQTLINEN